MNTPKPYLIDLNDRLAAAAAEWPEAASEAFARFTLDHYVDGRGFLGRSGEPDVYYTAFALRTLAVLGWDIEPIRAGLLNAVDRLLVRSLPDQLSVQFIKHMLAAGDDSLNAEILEQLRCENGGYAKTPGGTSSTYATFLIGLAYDLAGQVPPEMEWIGRFVLTCRRDDGGFAELAQMPGSSINPTAAAAAVAMAAGVMDTPMVDGVSGFLVGTQRDDGGWPASPRVDMSDLLSTFTALLTLSDLGAADQADLAAAERFVRACRVRPYGFGGSPDDSDADVEYTFYGVGALAMLGAQP
jgi:geranylgeranyl transferase type-2 subunit beta